MKFFQVGDVHLGATPDPGFPWGDSRKDEIWDSFCRLINKAEEERIDLLLLAGDLFHRQPLLRELKEVNYLFSRLTKTKVVLIAGNHDFIKNDSYYRGFMWHENVTFLASPGCQKIVFEDIGACVYGFSYHAREIREPLYDDLQPDRDVGLCHILLAHGGDENHIPIDKRKLLNSGFDYIALGHIHKPQILADNRMVYAGVIEPLDKNDLGAHGFFEGEWQEGRIHIHFVPWAVRDYIVLEVEVDKHSTDFSIKVKIQERINERGAQHIYRIRLTGFRDADIIFQTAYYLNLGNVIEVTDDTKPAYDLTKLMHQHREDVIGQYMETLMRPDMNRMEEKALYYGIQALLETKG